MQIKTDREQDGLVGAVQSVHEEIACILRKSNKWVIGPRRSQVITAYDYDGTKVSQSFHEPMYGQPLSEYGVTKHDIGGNIIEHYRYHEDVHQNDFLFTYDEQGRKIEQRACTPEGAVLHKTVYKYDARGKAVEMMTFGADDSLLAKHTYVNEYDSIGNLIKITVRRWTNVGGKLIYQPLCEIYKTITYY